LILKNHRKITVPTKARKFTNFFSKSQLHQQVKRQAYFELKKNNLLTKSRVFLQNVIKAKPHLEAIAKNRIQHTQCNNHYFL